MMGRSGSTPLKLNVSCEGGVVVLEPAGSLDRNAARDLHQQGAELLRSGERLFVIDLGRTQHISGPGLRVLLMLTRQLQAMGGSLSLCAVQPEAGEALRLAGLTRLFSITNTRDEALQRLSSDAAVARLADLVAGLLAIAEERELAGRALP
jgi:anti-anti-sigma factor